MMEEVTGKMRKEEEIKEIKEEVEKRRRKRE
jgi:hypothetical protein